MSWFKITIRKGKMKKRAHKKFMKNSQVSNYLESLEKALIKIHNEEMGDVDLSKYLVTV